MEEDDILKMIKDIEELSVLPGQVPGTAIQRVLTPRGSAQDWEWCISAGPLHAPKVEVRNTDLGVALAHMRGFLRLKRLQQSQ